jgi:hypothetical protein
MVFSPYRRRMKPDEDTQMLKSALLHSSENTDRILPLFLSLCIYFLCGANSFKAGSILPVLLDS